MQRIPLILVIATFLCASCKVDFSPNAEWQEIPQVYCVLDQDDSLTYVRVQKAFLGNGNQMDYVSVFDSIHYPQGEIYVRMLEWDAVRGKQNLLSVNPNATAPRRVFDFQYELMSEKDDGMFSSPLQPVYVCNTYRQLDTACVYQLLVLKHDSGDTLAQALTSLLGDCTDMNTMLSKPNSADKFNFSGSGTNKYCNMIWYTLPRARQYQPIIMFHYKEFYREKTGSDWDTTMTPHDVRVNGPVLKSNMNTNSLTTRISIQSFMAVVKDSITAYQQRHDIDPYAYRNDDNREYALVAEPYVNITVLACNEEFAAYLFSQQTPDGINQEPFTYTNIQGGLGVFASRRAHLDFVVPAYMANTGGYMKALKELNVGF